MLTQKNGQVVAGPSVGAFLHPSGIRLYLRSLWRKIKKGIGGYFVNDNGQIKRRRQAVVIRDKSGVRGSEFTEWKKQERLTGQAIASLTYVSHCPACRFWTIFLSIGTQKNVSVSINSLYQLKTCGSQTSSSRNHELGKARIKPICKEQPWVSAGHRDTERFRQGQGLNQSTPTKHYEKQKRRDRVI